MNFRRRRPREDDTSTWGYGWVRRAPVVSERVPRGFRGGRRRKKPRPYAIESKFIRSLFSEPKWHTRSRYVTEAARDEALRRLQKKHRGIIEYRVAS